MRQIRPAGLLLPCLSLIAIICCRRRAAAQVTCGPLPAPTGNVIDVTPAQAGSLRSIVGAAKTGDTVRSGRWHLRLASGAGVSNPGVTLRSASGNRNGVILDGQYKAGEIISAMESNITIADMTLTRAFYHVVHVSPSAGSTTGTLLHNLRIVDGAEQFVKVNNVGTEYTDNGIIRCSSLELTDTGRPQVRNDCYTGGIDIHQARGWQIYANTFDGFWCDTGIVRTRHSRVDGEPRYRRRPKRRVQFGARHRVRARVKPCGAYISGSALRRAAIRWSLRRRHHEQFRVRERSETYSTVSTASTRASHSSKPAVPRSSTTRCSRPSRQVPRRLSGDFRIRRPRSLTTW